MNYTLTDKEKYILQELSKGMRHKEIAKSLGMSKAHIEALIFSLRERWNCANTIQLVIFVIQNKILDFSQENIEDKRA